MGAQCVDEEALFLASDFPIKPEDLIARAKEVLTAGIGTKDEGVCLAEGFEFCAPVVGPLPKEEYLKALGNFKLEESFDLNAQYHLFRVDPTQTNRVWFHTRTLGKHVADSTVFGKATNKEIVNPPQCMHLDFTADGLVKEFGATRRPFESSLAPPPRHRRDPRRLLHRGPQTGQHGRPWRRLRLLLRRRPAAPHPGVPALQAVEALPPTPATRQAPGQVLQEGRVKLIHVSRATVVACV